MVVCDSCFKWIHEVEPAWNVGFLGYYLFASNFYCLKCMKCSDCGNETQGFDRRYRLEGKSYCGKCGDKRTVLRVLVKV